MEENELRLAAALAGVTTVDLGGAGAGRHLQAAVEGRNAEPEPGDSAEADAEEPSARRRDVWRELLFRNFRPAV